MVHQARINKYDLVESMNVSSDSCSLRYNVPAKIRRNVFQTHKYAGIMLRVGKYILLLLLLCSLDTCSPRVHSVYPTLKIFHAKLQCLLVHWHTN